MTGTPPWFPQAVSPVSSFSSQRFLAQILRDCSLTFCRSHVCSTPRSSRASDAAAARSATLHCSGVTRSASRSSSLLFHSGIAAAAVQRIHTARTHASISSHEDFAHRPALPSLPLFLLLISFAALSFASRSACVTLSRLLSHPLFSPWPMGTVHCAWLRSSASATVVFPFSPSLLALGPLARQGSRSWRHASASPGGRRCEPRAGAAVAHVTHGKSR